MKIVLIYTYNKILVINLLPKKNSRYDTLLAKKMYTRSTLLREHGPDKKRHIRVDTNLNYSDFKM